MSNETHSPNEHAFTEGLGWLDEIHKTQPKQSSKNLPEDPTPPSRDLFYSADTLLGKGKGPNPNETEE